jgi:hypothetical protein
MTITINSSTYRDFDVQQLVETTKGVFAQKTAFLGRALASQGAVIVNPSMPYGGPNFIGNEVTIPYFGTMGEFETRTEGNPAVVNTLKQTNERATIACESLAFEVSRWAQNSGPDDPYVECARQILESAERAMDRAIITAAAATPLVHDVYSATVPKTLDYDTIVDARSKWGDENERPVAMIVHSRAMTDLRKLKDADGHPLTGMMSVSEDGLERFNGMVLVESDRMPLTSSSMGTVTSSGTTPPVMTITGTPLGAFNLVVDCVLGGAHETATVRFSTDGGNTWSATLTTLAAAASLALTDTAIDSLVGVNGRTGLSVAFAAGTFNADNQWTSTALLKATTLLVQRNALTFWYNRANMALDTDKDILRHTDSAAMHIYRAAHLYRRRPGSTKPGVIAVRHNVSGYVG